MPGESIGTSRNTKMTKDITLAIAAPECLSRTMATDI